MVLGQEISVMFIKQYAKPGDQFVGGEQQGALPRASLVTRGVIGNRSDRIDLLGCRFFCHVAESWRWSPPNARELAFVPMLACVTVLFPFNTHLAFYATFWGGCWLMLLALYAGCLGAQDRFQNIQCGEAAMTTSKRSGYHFQQCRDLVEMS